MDRSVHPTTTILEDVGFPSKLRWTKVSIQPYQYHRVLEYQYQRVLEFYPRPMDQSVHQTATISTHVGSLIQIIVVCPYKHTNLMTRPTYGGDYFPVGLPDQFPVNVSESTERMLAGE